MNLPWSVREAGGGPSHAEVRADSLLDPRPLDAGQDQLLIQNQIYLKLSPAGPEIIVLSCYAPSVYALSFLSIISFPPFPLPPLLPLFSL